MGRIQEYSAINCAVNPRAPLCHANSEMLERLIPYHNIETITSPKVTRRYLDPRRAEGRPVRFKERTGRPFHLRRNGVTIPPLKPP